MWRILVSSNYKSQLFISFLLRLLLISYGIYHDSVSRVKYTDVDYRVFTDASRHIVEGSSPFDRHTYRYSPIVAILLIPNVVFHHSFGKVLFCFVDVIVGLLIRIIVKRTLYEFECYKQSSRKNNRINSDVDVRKNRKKHRQCNRQDTGIPNDELDLTANIAMAAWLYNPLTIAIGTRGNCDSIAACFVLLTLYFLQCKRHCFVAGLMHGLSIHFRLYPIIYSLTMFMYLSKKSFYSIGDRRLKIKLEALEDISKPRELKNTERTPKEHDNIVPFDHEVLQCKTIFKVDYLLYLVPNLEQLKLVTGCCLSFTFFTWLFYYLYGYKFLYETYLYHVVRKDFRHNFSLYFYLQYLTAWVKNIGVWQKVLMLLPQLVLIAVFSVRYGLNRFSLNFSILTQTIVMVIYNAVLTSQYFVWIMAVLPLCLWQIQIRTKMALFLLTIWFVAQGVWLLPAYLLEFQGQNTFLFIWIQSVSFFCANIAILGRLIMFFRPVKDKSE